MFETPILFAFYIREDTTIKVFEKIAEIKPAKLYLSSDGAISQNDQSIVNNLRNKILSMIDWPCIVSKKFNESNLGCGIGMSSAVSWFFENEESGIILEDDCLPSQSFFEYCEELLKFHKDDPEIWHISGSVLFKKENYIPSYYYSVYPGMWGWATWANKWKKYKFNMSDIDIDIKSYDRYNKNKISFDFWEKIRNDMINNKIDTWDYQWIFTIWKNNGICITPNYNLISNIGFGDLATHTIQNNDIRSKMSIDELNKIVHPKNKKETYNDNVLKERYFSSPTIFNKIFNKIFNYNN